MRGVGVEPQVGVAVEGLRVLALPCGDLGLVDPHLAVLDPGLEALEPFAGVVRADAGRHAEVPAMQPADQILADHASVGEQRAAMQAAAVEDRDRLVDAHDHEVDVGDEGVGGRSVLELGPTGHRDRPATHDGSRAIRT